MQLEAALASRGSVPSHGGAGQAAASDHAGGLGAGAPDSIVLSLDTYITFGKTQQRIERPARGTMQRAKLRRNRAVTVTEPGPDATVTRRAGPGRGSEIQSRQTCHGVGRGALET